MAAMKATLWEITDEYAEVGALIAEGGGELTDELAARLDAVEDSFENKVERIALVIQDKIGDAEKAKSEEKRLGAIRKYYERQASGLKDYLAQCMAAAGIRKSETPRARVRLQKSSTPSVTYGGELDALPESFIRVVPETRVLDKKAVTVAFKDGEELPAGLSVTYSESVRIN